MKKRPGVFANILALTSALLRPLCDVIPTNIREPLRATNVDIDVSDDTPQPCYFCTVLF